MSLQQPIMVGPTSFKIGISSIPTQITDVILRGLLYIEFIEVGELASTGDPARDAARALQPDKRKNHAVIRVPFLNPILYGGDSSSLEFESFTGILISMELAESSIDSNRGYFERDVTQGELILKLIRYDEFTHNAMHVLSVNLAKDLSVGQFIYIAQYYKLDKFKFTRLGFTLVGCRDFVTQFLLRLIESGYCSSTCNETKLPIIDHMAYRYYLYNIENPVATHYPTPLLIDKGTFTDPGFVRVTPQARIYN